MALRAFAGYGAVDLHPIHYLETARRLKNQLLKTNQSLVFLHGDLHQGNIIWDGIEWKMIDPKGVIGYAINEVWPFIKDVAKEAPYIATIFSVEVPFVLQWYFVHAILAAC